MLDNKNEFHFCPSLTVEFPCDKKKRLDAERRERADPAKRQAKATANEANLQQPVAEVFIRVGRLKFSSHLARKRVHIHSLVGADAASATVALETYAGQSLPANPQVSVPQPAELTIAALQSDPRPKCQGCQRPLS